MKIVEKAAPNGFQVRLLIDESGWAVREPDGFLVECDSEAEARSVFSRTIKEFANTPNWEAQVAYDDAHGTYNGYSEFQFQREC